MKSEREPNDRGSGSLSIVVVGLWHLGTVTAACCARHFRVAGLDDDTANIARLSEGKAPLFESGLNELLAAGLQSKRLSFTTDPASACAEADVVWLCADTPVNEDDESEVDAVLAQLRCALASTAPGTLVLISAQLPVGTCAALEREFPDFQFACSPENLRLGKAIESFEKADRVVIGTRSEQRRELLQELFAPFTSQILFMRTESAEMVKHALNSFLAVSVTFINEIARLCELTGADAKEVSAGLKSEPRIGLRAYLGPGGPFAGGTLARDVVTLTKLGRSRNEPLSLIPAIKQSNDLHRGWMFRRLQMRLGELRAKTITVLGLTYKPGTDTLRRSAAVELCHQLLRAGARVRAFDPLVKTSAAGLEQVAVLANVEEAVNDADAVVLCTEWPEFRDAPWPKLVSRMRSPIVVDANRFLEKELKDMPGVEHLSVGRAL